MKPCRPQGIFGLSLSWPRKQRESSDWGNPLTKSGVERPGNQGADAVAIIGTEATEDCVFGRQSKKYDKYPQGAENRSDRDGPVCDSNHHLPKSR